MFSSLVADILTRLLGIFIFINKGKRKITFYITYLNIGDYIKALDPGALKVSLWNGDVVLNNLVFFFFILLFFY